MVRPRGIVQWSLPFNIELVDGCLVLKEHVNYNILSIVASYMEWSTTMGIDDIHLRERERKRGRKRE